MIDYKKYENIVHKFISKYKNKKWFVGACISGSFVTKKMTEKSDIDVFIFTKGINWRKKGSKIINGIQIEYFINPIELMKNNIKKEFGVHRLETSIFKNAKVIYDSHGEVKNLIKLAQKQAKIKSKPMSKQESKYFRYIIFEAVKDVEESLERNDLIAFHRLIYKTIEDCILAVYQYYGKWLPAYKHIDEDLKKIDPKFANLILNYFNQRTNSSRLKAYKRIIKYVVNLYGGPIKEYELKCFIH